MTRDGERRVKKIIKIVIEEYLDYDSTLFNVYYDIDLLFSNREDYELDMFCIKHILMNIQRLKENDLEFEVQMNEGQLHELHEEQLLDVIQENKHQIKTLKKNIDLIRDLGYVYKPEEVASESDIVELNGGSAELDDRVVQQNGMR